MSFQAGQNFGDYTVLAVLGSSGLGDVYKVEHRLTNRIEAMKVLSGEQATDVQVKRFEREMRALARLSHPNIAALHNAIHEDNQFILLMEFIEGETLEVMLRQGRIPFATGIGYIRQILAALGYAHQQGVVHRDVTPAKVMITAAGEAKLIDFGLSKSYGDALLTTCGEIFGSLPYLAPEQLKGATQPNRRSDLYSVGAILYEHLTGQKPFGEHRALAPVITDSEPEPQPPSAIDPKLGTQWDEVIRRALARDPVHRYSSAEEFLNAITQLDQTPAAADLPLPQLRRLGWVSAIFAGLVLAVFASPAFYNLKSPARPEVPWQRLHIPRPDLVNHNFVRETTPILAAKPKVAKAVHAKPVEKRAVETSRKQMFDSAPAITKAPVVLAPAPQIPVAPPPEVPGAVASAATVSAATDPPVQAETPAETAPAKRKFWSKWNVFKKHADPKDKSQHESE